MPLSKPDYFRILILVMIAIAVIGAWLLHFRQHPTATPITTLSLWALVAAAILLWSRWLFKRGALLGVIFTFLAGFAAFADWMRGEHLWSAGFSALFLFGAALSVRKLYCR